MSKLASAFLRSTVHVTEAKLTEVKHLLVSLWPASVSQNSKDSSFPEKL